MNNECQNAHQTGTMSATPGKCDGGALIECHSERGERGYACGAAGSDPVQYYVNSVAACKTSTLAPFQPR